ncbi:uncharacterized protein [Ptychodera flava]|uniref:uncharacterized protein n=1 Tax=Ptychodera flava TaxID=63121 RepID=UPI00396A959E
MASNETTLSSCMTKINTFVECIDPNQLTEGLNNIGGCLSSIKSFMDSLATFPEGDYSLKSNFRDVKFQTRQVLTSIFDEMVELRSFRRVAVDALWCLKKELDFMAMDIDTFLEANKLSKYKEVFEEEEIFYARELLNEENIKIDDLKSVMKPASFNRLKEKLREAEKVKSFLKNEMEDKLNNAGAVCQSKSEAVNVRLNNALRDLGKAAEDTMKSIDDAKKRAEFRKLMFDITKFAAGIMISYYGFGMVSALSKGVSSFANAMVYQGTMTVAGVQLRSVAQEGIRNVTEDLEIIKALREDIEGQASKWSDYTENTITNWTILIKELKKLLDMLKKDVKAVHDPVITDLRSHLDTSKTALDSFGSGIDKLEEEVKRVVAS